MICGKGLSRICIYFYLFIFCPVEGLYECPEFHLLSRPILGKRSCQKHSFGGDNCIASPLLSVFNRATSSHEQGVLSICSRLSLKIRPTRKQLISQPRAVMVWLPELCGQTGGWVQSWNWLESESWVSVKQSLVLDDVSVESQQCPPTVEKLKNSVWHTDSRVLSQS